MEWVLIFPTTYDTLYGVTKMSTGTMVNVATGLEPYYAFTYYRSGRLGKFIEVNAPIVDEYLANNPGKTKEDLPSYFVSAMQLTPEAHVDTQCVIQRWIDSSLSKTVNAPKGYTVEQVQKVYERLFHGGAKGGTVYVDGSRDAQVLTLTNDENEHEESPLSVQVITDTPAPVEKEEVVIGSNAGNTCPVCRQGIVEDIGGCSTCTSCTAQLKCGL